MSSTNAVLSGAPPVAQPTKEPKTFPAMIEQYKAQIAVALPKHLNAERMARVALTEFRKNPRLGECEPISVFASVIMAAQLGLEPGLQGQSYLVPYFDNKRDRYICQFIPGWRGLVDLTQRSGRATCWTGAVFDGDEFDYEFGSNPFIRHKPHGEENPEKLLFVYAVGRVRGAEFPQIDVWPMAKVIAHRNRFNKVGGMHYSYKHPEMYARKVPLLQVLKYLPQSIELSTAVALEHAAQTEGQRLDIKEAIEGAFTFIPEGTTEDIQANGAEGAQGASTPTQTDQVKEQLRGRQDLKGADTKGSDTKKDGGPKQQSF